MSSAAAPIAEAVVGAVEDHMEERAEAQAKADKEKERDNSLRSTTGSIRVDGSAVLSQGGSLRSREDSMVDLRCAAQYDGLDVEPTPQLVESIALVEAKDYPKAMRILRKNLETPGTVNWCRIQLYCSYATFFHCSNLYFSNKERAELENKKCCGDGSQYLALSEEMRGLIRGSLKDCHEVATTILDAEKSVKGEELDMTCQMCFSIMSLGNAYGLHEEKFLELALGLAGVWANKRNTVLAHTEKVMLESKRLDDPMAKLTERMEEMSKDITKLSDNVKSQGGGGGGSTSGGKAILTAVNIASSFM